ncbi:hypothetical protein MJ257_11900 [Paenibacillus timonensis]|uniref:Uncharacterized protein n=1 Tax=Paenibacillus timonensis TaxID=225915 RepID=A0ABW3SBY9_9BACL|nr:MULTISPECIES: hypothetical protein [Paenibacillus]MCH1640811.1 hypothetical protein [Paenibacillus timonensis]MDU2242316.1 hypothetical protein [Paenibacillus sp.]
MLIRKYLITLLIAVFTIGYTVWVDVLIGLPWNNFIINWNYSLTDPAERIFAYLLVLFLVVPDILHLASRKRKKDGQNSGEGAGLHGGSMHAMADKDSSVPLDDSSSGLPSGAESINRGSNNQGGGQNNVK